MSLLKVMILKSADGNRGGHPHKLYRIVANSRLTDVHERGLKGEKDEVQKRTVASTLHMPESLSPLQVTAVL